MKVCDKCKAEKSLEDFYKNGSGKGYRKICKKCFNQEAHKNKNSTLNKYWLTPEYKRARNSRLSYRYSKYAENAKKRSLNFDLTIEEFEKLTSKRCHYCEEYSLDYKFCGLDRKDSDRGYEASNVVPCCSFCNFLKRNVPYEEFLKRIKKIYTTLVVNRDT